MYLTSFAVGPWLANTYLVGAAGSRRCVVVDPGVLADGRVRSIVDAEGLTVEAVLLTHGHLDHVASAAVLADHYGVPAYLHEADRALLTEPGLLPAAVITAQFGVVLAEPADLRLLRGGETISAAGLEFEVLHAPGHRPGCVMFRVAGDRDDTVFTGDVVFAGSIGRTDLPGGDPDAMVDSLSRVVLGLRDAAVLLPGHDRRTTMARERRDNPYLQPAFLRMR